MLTLYDAFAQSCAAAPEQPCLAESASSGGQVWTYGQVGQIVDELARTYASRNEAIDSGFAVLAAGCRMVGTN